MYQIIYFYPNLQYQALFELLTAPLIVQQILVMNSVESFR